MTWRLEFSGVGVNGGGGCRGLEFWRLCSDSV